MNLDLKKKLLLSYMSSQDAANLIDMIDKPREVILKKTLNGINVAKKPESIRGSITLFNEVSQSSGFIIGRYVITNITEEPQVAIIEIILNRSRIIRRECVLAPKETKIDVVHLVDEEFDGLADNSVNCRAGISDSIGREIFKDVTTTIIKQSSSSSSSELSAVLRFDEYDTIGLLPVIVTIKSNDVHQRNCIISVFADSQLLLEKRYCIKPHEELNDIVDIHVNSDSCGTLNAVVTCEGIQVANATKKLSYNIGSSNHLDPHPSKCIFADIRLDAIIDTNNQKGGMVEIGVIGICNSDDCSEHIGWRISLDGVKVDSSSMILEPNSNIDKTITIPVKMLSKDDTYAAVIRCSMYDCNTNVILDRVSQITVRSRFDTDLRRLPELTAKYINPLDPEVKHFVDSKDGLLSKTMGEKYVVSGYQASETILLQLKSVFDAIRDCGISYVSDTSAMNENGCFQRIRDPPTVIRDRSGNCIELSILMASIYECMGFESIIVFPRGHAIVGIVMDTNMYETNSVMAEGVADSVVRLNNGGYVDALFIESTAVANKEFTFAEAVTVAKKEVEDEMGFITSNNMYTLKIKSEKV